MKLWCLSVVLCIATCGFAQDGGGRDVSVALFSSQAVKSVTVAPLSASAWTARCATCAHEPLQRPFIIEAHTEVFAGGTLRVTEETSQATRTATGLWHLRSNATTHDVDVVLTLPSERYITAVLNAEASPNEPAQSLQALAILVRTYALNGKHDATQPGHLPADLCDSTACQAMSLRPSSLAVEDAARQTAGETLWFGAHRSEVFFSQSCGGVTEDAGMLWPNLRGTSYLQSHTDPFCVKLARAAWSAQVTLVSLMTIAKSEGWHLPSDITAASITQRTPSHRALRIQFSNRAGETAFVSASALRFSIDQALGWNQVRSDAYELGVRNGALVFDGHGHGHGVGLCQSGATQMALEGRSTKDILAFYFPGTAIRISPQGEGWQESRTASLTLNATKQLTPAHQAELQRLWMETQRLFPPHHPVTPRLVFTPSVELFRQITGQPGWMLASTSGDTIVLQPETILHTHQRNETTILLHEMLHVSVEAECSAHTPLWLREGLVEVLAGEAIPIPAPPSTQSIEEELLHPSSQRANERAHLAAAAKVKELIARYGASSVRGWLASGPPSGIA